MLERIRNDLIQALKKQDKVKLAVLRRLLAELKNQEINYKRQLNQAETLVLIKKQVKELKEANLLYVKGDRLDLVAQNNQEMAILNDYLPPELSEVELRAKVKAILSANTNITNKNQLIGLCIKELKGQADSGQIVALVNQLL